MRILVVGDAGMIGGHAVLISRGERHEVAIAGRRAPAAGTPIGALPFLQGYYIANNLDRADLSQFDVLVFAAGHDVRSFSCDSYVLPSNNALMASRHTCQPARSFGVCFVILLIFRLRLSGIHRIPDTARNEHGLLGEPPRKLLVLRQHGLHFLDRVLEPFCLSQHLSNSFQSRIQTSLECKKSSKVIIPKSFIT